MTREEMEQREYLATYIYDAYKDAHGIRPRWMDFDAMSIEELERTANDLSDLICDQIQQERRERQVRGMEICFALHHPQGHIFMSDDEFDLCYAQNGEPLRDEIWLDFYFYGTVIHVNVAPKVTLGDLFKL